MSADPELLARWASIPNERSEELPWLLTRDLAYPILDVGCHESTYLDALAKDGPVDGIDVRHQDQGILRHFYQDDIRTWLAPEPFPTICAVSTVEHIGLAFEPYGTSADDPDGDKHAVSGIRANLAPGGTLYLTVPFGDPEHFGWFRRYGTAELAALLDGWYWEAEFKFNPDWQVQGVALVTART